MAEIPRMDSWTYLTTPRRVEDTVTGLAPKFEVREVATHMLHLMTNFDPDGAGVLEMVGQKGFLNISCDARAHPGDCHMRGTSLCGYGRQGTHIMHNGQLASMVGTVYTKD
jgi:hypothetical protein